MSKEDFSEMLSMLPKDLRCEIEENNQRKGYGILEKAEIQKKLLQRFQKEFTPGRKSKINGSENCQKLDTLKSLGMTRIDDLIGKLTGESKETVRKNRIIYNAVQKNPGKLDSLVKRVDQGKASHTILYRLATRREKQLTPPYPKGMSDVIYADPAWQYRRMGSGAAEDHYQTIPTDEICEMGKKIPIANDAVLFLWTTSPMLEDGLKVVKAWGFDYKTKLEWIKQKNGKLQGNGIGSFVIGVSESLLIGTKGNIGIPLPENRPYSVIFAPKGKHSEKPPLYDLIEKMYPDRKYLELFARNPKSRPNWTHWGDEAGNST